MLVNNEEKLKIVVQTAIGTALLCTGSPMLGAACFALMLPWGILGRVAGWLVRPVMAWRRAKGVEHAQPQAT